MTATIDLERGRLTVITGPSGVGKGSLVNELLERNREIWLSISATTRAPRVGEVNGEHYFFVEKDEFNELVANRGLLEWAEFSGNFYGTPHKPVMKKLQLGFPVLLEIELEGARQVRKSCPEAFQIFVAPPSFEELERRIRGRGTENEQAIFKRLARAKDEISASNEFNAVIINDNLNLAVQEIEKLMGLIA